MGNFIVSNFLILAIASMLVSVALMFFVRRMIGLEFLREHHEVSDPLLACVGTLFAILLGFMVANAMTRSEDARVNVEREAGAIGDLVRLSRGLPADSGNKIREDCFKYVNGVIEVEWKLMEERKMSYDVWNSYGQIWADTLSFEPRTDRENNIHATMLNCMVTLGDCRRVRATQMSYAVPTILWVVVLIGAFATGTLVLFFGINSMRVQAFTTALVTLVLYLNVFLLACYDDPFSGEVAVKSHAFKVARDSLERRYKSDVPAQIDGADQPKEIEADDTDDSDPSAEDYTGEIDVTDTSGSADKNKSKPHSATPKPATKPVTKLKPAIAKPTK